MIRRLFMLFALVALVLGVINYYQVRRIGREVEGIKHRLGYDVRFNMLMGSAQEHFLKGKRYADLGDLERARAEFEEAKRCTDEAMKVASSERENALLLEFKVALSKGLKALKGGAVGAKERIGAIWEKLEERLKEK